ncbi:hypothetical protein BGZ68_004382 [Mortierella alpina]|nr:hypothetical protein BGZ68_004382 [Mortierella alpina]
MRLTFSAFRNLGLLALAVHSCVRAAPVQEKTSLLEKRGLGVNDWSCKPSADKPYSLVLVHGTFFPAAVTNTRFLLKGYSRLWPCASAARDWRHGQIEVSAAQLSEFVDKVLAATGTTQFDMMGHSQGDLMPLYYIKRLGGAAKVHKIGALAPITHGTDLLGIVQLGRLLNLYDPVTKVLNEFCASCLQMVYGSDFLKDLHQDGDTIPGIQYFYLATKYDEIVTPYTRSFLLQTNANATNAVIQDFCSIDVAEHVLLFTDPLAFNILENFFSPSATPRTFNCGTLLSK